MNGVSWPCNSTRRWISSEHNYLRNGSRFRNHQTFHSSHFSSSCFRTIPRGHFRYWATNRERPHYDFDIPDGVAIKEELEKIEQKMRQIIQADQAFVGETTVEQALKYSPDHPYKCEIIESADKSEVDDSETISFYQMGMVSCLPRASCPLHWQSSAL